MTIGNPEICPSSQKLPSRAKGLKPANEMAQAARVVEGGFWKVDPGFNSAVLCTWNITAIFHGKLT